MVQNLLKAETFSLLMKQSNKLILEVSGKGIPLKPTPTNIYVIAGAPGSGKSSLLKALQLQHYEVVFEPAELLLKEEIESGKTAGEVRKDPVEWQTKVVQADFELFQSLEAQKTIFTDTSLIETLVFARRGGMKFGGNLTQFLINFRFKEVFFLEPLTLFESTRVRLEDQQTAAEISRQIWDTYQEFDYQPFVIPPVSVDKRIELILNLIKSPQ